MRKIERSINGLKLPSPYQIGEKCPLANKLVYRMTFHLLHKISYTTPFVKCLIAYRGLNTQNELYHWLIRESNYNGLINHALSWMNTKEGHKFWCTLQMIIMVILSDKYSLINKEFTEAYFSFISSETDFVIDVVRESKYDLNKIISHPRIASIINRYRLD